MIAAYVPPGSGVLDLGAGAQTLARHLAGDCTYQPCDIVPGSGVLECDLDAGRWPAVARRYDVAICSGVLEYLRDVPGVLSGLAPLATRAIVTYCDRSRGQRLETRRRQGWQSHMTLSQLRGVLDGLDAEWRFLTEWRGHVICAIDYDAELPPLRDGEGLIEEAAWESAFAGLEAYVQRTGGARVPSSLVDGELALGAWVQAQRRLRRRGTLSARRTARLETLPGWTWRARVGGSAPAIAREPGLGEGSLRPLRVETERAEWMTDTAQGDRVLDLTCGLGTSAVALARAGVRVVGFDRDPAALERVRARLSEETPETRKRLSFVPAAEGPLPIADRAFDTVLLADVPERAADLEELLDEARRLVRPGGRIVLSSLLEVSPPALSRPHASLGRLVRELGPRLRPAQIVDGERWVGVVTVPALAPGPGMEPWTALLEMAEARLSRVGEAYADQAVQLAETRTRERELSARAEDLAASLARSERDLEAVRREARDAATRVGDVESRLADAIATAAAAREEATEAERRMTADAAARERRLSGVRAEGRALARESDRREQHILALQAELHEAVAAAQREQAQLQQAVTTAQREREELTGRIAELERVRERESELIGERARERESELIAERTRLRADLRVQTARAARAQAHVERRNTQLAELRASRAHRLAVRWWRVRKRLRHPFGGVAPPKPPP